MGSAEVGLYLAVEPAALHEPCNQYDKAGMCCFDIYIFM